MAHAVAWQDWWRCGRLRFHQTAYTNAHISIPSTARAEKSITLEQNNQKWGHRDIIRDGCKSVWERDKENLRNMHASPVTSFFEVEKSLQPLVSKCLSGLPTYIVENSEIWKDEIMWETVVHIVKMVHLSFNRGYWFLLTRTVKGNYI